MLYLRRRYGKVEYARRGRGAEAGRALHFHLLLRVQHLDQLLADYRAKDPHCPFRELAIERGFGHAIDVKLAQHGHAWYCAKYVSKTADDRTELPFVDKRTGEVTTGNDRYRPWSASKRWGLTMAQVRAAQAAWASQNGPASPEPSGAPQPPLAAAEALEAPQKGRRS